MIRRAFPLLLCLLFLACNKKVSASNDFKDAVAEFKPAMKTFTTEFPKHERALQQLRDSDPAAAAKKIDVDVLPLIDAVVAALAKAIEAGGRYVEYATDEDPKLVAQISKNVEQLERQRDGFVKVRDAYAAQAQQLAKGKLTDKDSVAFVNAVQDAMRMVQN